MPTDPLDLADPIRLLILLLPERYRAPAAVLLSALVASQIVAATIVARLPLSAREHPRWGRVVRALHWYSVLRLRDEQGSAKLPGADVGARVTPVAPVAPDAPDAPAGAVHVTARTTAAQLAGEVALQPPTRADERDLRVTVAPAPPAVAPLRGVTLTGVAEADEEARLAAARAFVARETGGFDASRTQDVTHAAQAARAPLDPTPANDRSGEGE